MGSYHVTPVTMASYQWRSPGLNPGFRWMKPCNHPVTPWVPCYHGWLALLVTMAGHVIRQGPLLRLALPLRDDAEPAAATAAGGFGHPPCGGAHQPRCHGMVVEPLGGVVDQAKAMNQKQFKQLSSW